MKKIKLLKFFQKHIVQFLIAFIVLNVIIILPSQKIPVKPPSIFKATSGFRVIFSFVWISIDLIFIITILYFARNWKHQKRLRRICVGLFIFIWIYEIYEVMILLFYRRPPILYNDLLLIVDGFNFFVSLLPQKWLIMIFLVIILGFMFYWLIPKLINTMKLGLAQISNQQTALIIGGIIWLTIGFIHVENSVNQRDTIAQWVMIRLVENAKKSFRLHANLKSLSRQSIDSVYYSFNQIQLNQQPNIHLFIVESYGKILAKHPELKDLYIKKMQKMEHELSGNGWFTTTNYSTPPIRGGASWLSFTSILSGIRIDNVPLFHRYTSGAYPNMVQFFRQQGYQTFTLQPANKDRPGRPANNPFAFDTPIFFNDLNYTGYQYGWTLVPDQYSLNYTHEHFLNNLRDPFFLFFTTVSTHAPWTEIPHYYADWHQITESPNEADRSAQGLAVLVKKLAFILNRKLLKPYSVENYPKLIFYDLKVIQDYILNRAPENSIIIIVGDHQPPLLLVETDGSDTPIHVISTDSTYIESLRSYGFIDGMIKDIKAANSIRHEAIFSILVQTLVNQYGIADDRKLLTLYRPDGISPSILK